MPAAPAVQTEQAENPGHWFSPRRQTMRGWIRKQDAQDEIDPGGEYHLFQNTFRAMTTMTAMTPSTARAASPRKIHSSRMARCRSFMRLYFVPDLKCGMTGATQFSLSVEADSLYHLADSEAVKAEPSVHGAIGRQILAPQTVRFWL